jgi:DNA polymerase-1
MGVWSEHDDSITESKADLKEARAGFYDRLAQHRPVDGIITLGNEALFTVLGHSGIMKHRGHVGDYDGIPVMPTIALGAVDRNPHQAIMLQGDIAAMYRTVYDVEVEEDEPKTVRVVHTQERVDELLAALSSAEACAWDLETSGFDELVPGAFVVSLAVTLLEGKQMRTWVLPVAHPGYHWADGWYEPLHRISTAMCKVPTRIAHNAKFDCRWMCQVGCPVPVNFDTMLAAHILDENRPKGLKPLATFLLDAKPWDIKINNGKGQPPWYEQYPLKEILRYNALDTWHTMRLYRLFKEQIEEDPRVARLFYKLIMPASQSLVHIERHGAYVDQEALIQGADYVRKQLARIHRRLMRDVPEEYAESVNFNPSNFLRWWLYDYLQVPITKVGKIGPSVSEQTLSHIKDSHRVIPLLLERVRWQKYESSFFNPYQALVTEDSRLHTTFKLAGTVTGRLSSGKADSDKVTGSRASTMRGINIQQVPREPLVRGIFSAPPGWTFVESDYSQIELRIAAELSGERTMRKLYALGEDIHMAMAVQLTGKPTSQITKEERKKAKAVNFGFLYGMGWRKFIETAWEKYELTVTEIEAQHARKAFFDQFPDLLPWHGRQRRLVHKFQRVQTPLGRIRHLPDIASHEQGVVNEAERQAINSPVQAMASDMCLLSLVLLDREFRRRGFKAIPIGTVHDAINFEVPNDELPDVLPLIKTTMENPPLKKLFDYELSIPLVADLQIGKHWGSNTPVPEEAFGSRRTMKEWLNVRSSHN